MPRVHYELPEDLHRRAKAAAAMRGVTLKDFLEWALELAIAEADRERQRTSGRRKKVTG